MSRMHIHIVKPRELRRALKTLDWTQRELAQYLGVSEGAVSMWVNGLRPLPGPVCKLIEMALSDLGGAK